MRPRMARLRYFLEQLWTVYSSVNARVEYTSQERKESYDKEVGESEMMKGHASKDGDLSSSPATTSTTTELIHAAISAANAASELTSIPSQPSASSTPIPLTQPLRSVQFNSFTTSQIQLRDWMLLVGVRELDFPNNDTVAVVLGNPAHFTKPVNDPILQPWIHGMLHHTRQRKIRQLRYNFLFATQMGLLSDGHIQPTDTFVQGNKTILSSESGYSILEPRIHFCNRWYDLTTAHGRDLYWNEVREQSFRVQHAHQMNKSGRDLNYTNEFTYKRPEDEKRRQHRLALLNAQNHTHLESITGDVRSSRSHPSSAVVVLSPNMPSLESHSGVFHDTLPRPANFSLHTPGSPQPEPILAVYPHAQFRDLYRRAHWLMGRSLEKETLERIRKVTPKLGEPPLTPAQIS